MESSFHGNSRTSLSRMKLSARCRYAARILIELAKHSQEIPLSASMLARLTGVSAQFIEKILKSLRKNGVTQSFRGSCGGHCLAKPAEEITFGQIIRLMEGGVSFNLCCSENPQECPMRHTCLTKRAWKNISETLERDLDAISLADLLKEANAGSEHSLLKE